MIRRFGDSTATVRAGDPIWSPTDSTTRREIWPVPPVTLSHDNRLDDEALDDLLEFYLRAGVDGLFILAYSGEIFELSAEEQVRICRRVVERCGGQLKIAASGNICGGLPRQIDQLKRIADAGPDVVVVLLSTLPDSDRLADDLSQIGETIGVPLGVYECPVPEHRLLSPEDIAAIASTGKFVFMKETSRNRATYRAKLQATIGTPLKLYQANWGELPNSLQDGGPGFCGIIANAFPELVDAFCNSELLSAVGRQALHDILASALSSIMERHYPASIKYVLQKRGLRLTTTSRMLDAIEVDAKDKVRLDDVLDVLSLLDAPEEFIATISSPAALDSVVSSVPRGPTVKTAPVAD